MSLKSFVIGLVILVLINILAFFVLEPRPSLLEFSIFSLNYAGIYVFISMVVSVVALGTGDTKLEIQKSDKIVRFEKKLILLAVAFWVPIVIIDVFECFGELSPIIVSILLTVSSGILIKFAEIEWSFMGQKFYKQRNGYACLGALMTFLSAWEIFYSSSSNNSFYGFYEALTKLGFALGLSLLFALFSKYIDAKVVGYSKG